MPNNTHRRLIAVYEDEATAARAEEALRRVTQAPVRTGEREDLVRALRGEMSQELEEAVIAPQAAFAADKHSARGFLVFVPIASLIGAIVVLPLAFITMGGLPLIGRLLICALIGAAGGGTVGMIVGQGLSARPDDQTSAQRGVTVGVDDDAEAVEAVLLDHHPLRIDRLDAADRVIENITSEDAQSDDGIFERLHDQLTQDPHGDWSSVRVDEGQEPRRDS